MPHPLIFLFGYVRLRLPREDAARVVNLLGRRARVYRNFCFDGDFASFECSFFSCRKVMSVCKEGGVYAEVTGRYGVPALLYRYRRRYGVFVGALLFLMITVASSFMLWDIRIIGNVSADAEEIKAEIRECGLREGTLLWSINTPVLENLVLIRSENVAWISINIVGTVAEVEIREEVPEQPRQNFLCADLIAERDGVVELFEQTRGNALVSIGDAVKKGDVLISGYYPADEEAGVGERYAVAKGRVLARTEREFSVSVPLEYEKKSYTGRKKCEKFFIFFGKEIKFFGNSGNLYANCDTINIVEYFELPGGVLLPFGVRTVRYLEYEKKIATLSQEAAVETALYRLRCLMADGVVDGMLLSKDITAAFEEGSYELRCRATYVENIARQVVREQK